MRALIDTNVLLDLVLDRAPFADQAEALWEAHRAGRFVGYISPISPVNVFYIVRKIKGIALARQAVQDVLKTFDVCVLDLASLETALILPLIDYEDAVQLAGAMANRLEAIVTRDPTGFKDAPILVFSPTEFIDQLPAAAK